MGAHAISHQKHVPHFAPTFHRTRHADAQAILIASAAHANVRDRGDLEMLLPLGICFRHSDVWLNQQKRDVFVGRIELRLHAVALVFPVGPWFRTLPMRSLLTSEISIISEPYGGR